MGATAREGQEFARALYAEAIDALLEGETVEGLSMLRDLVHAEITFKELARQTGLGEKTLHRMLNRRGKSNTVCPSLQPGKITKPHLTGKFSLSGELAPRVGAKYELFGTSTWSSGFRSRDGVLIRSLPTPSLTRLFALSG